MCLALMDENGDTGMKFGPGSSDRFGITIVLFQDLQQAAGCKTTIQQLLPLLRTKKHKEFHFNQLSDSRRRQLLNAVVPFQFRYFTSIIDKTKLSGRDWRRKEYMYRQACVRALDPALSEMLNAKLVFDQTSSEKFDKALLRSLKKHAGYREEVPVIKDTQRVKSHTDCLIQLADAVGGTVMADTAEYRRIIQAKEGSVAIFP